MGFAELMLSVEGGGVGRAIVLMLSVRREAEANGRDVVVPLRREYRVVVSVGVASESGGVAESSLDEGGRRTGFAIRLFSVGGTANGRAMVIVSLGGVTELSDGEFRELLSEEGTAVIRVITPGGPPIVTNCRASARKMSKQRKRKQPRLTYRCQTISRVFRYCHFRHRRQHLPHQIELCNSLTLLFSRSCKFVFKLVKETEFYGKRTRQNPPV